MERVEHQAGPEGESGELHRVRAPDGRTLAVIALDAPELGPGIGGCRMRPYPDLAAAVADARALARAMTTKVLLAGLPFSGAKAVVPGDPRTDKSPALWEALGAAIERLGGRYWTGEDSGTTPADMDLLARSCRFVLGCSRGAGDLGPMTAEGVFRAIRAAARARFGTGDLAGLTVAIQGLGAVGMPLAERLAAAGARLLVADLDPDKLARAVARLGARPVAPARLLETPAEVVAPCAFGPVLDAAVAERLRCAVIAGAANNQLAAAEIALRLHARGILYLPDYLVNAGGVIAAAAELEPGGYRQERVDARLGLLEARVERVLAEAAATGRPPLLVTEALAAQLRAHRLAATGRRARAKARYPTEAEPASLS
ncbi:MAG: Glu/Leu/Phe/Val dehydrogenase dimerization domain-containing protein [Geminicoccaceae bacterium]|nr:amino acid dehydrogenase [Geminicoccaceae bacterium]MCS7267656.1 amino acid dehydrogenase [Geminicoccaceae bacterium]MDW8123499.1 Glu/Leu/Phe/Val dehydrogenase dimerization domain-containing protein [Geminicoccaceae bacterium]MDW8342171.1 Glu/Leu/Phe/Val dehydrogenase dimerization domain-containing protein [Geminicoccaceae bacterium]